MPSIVSIISSLRPPTEEFINEDTIKEAMEVCPALNDLFASGQSGEFSTGLATGLGMAYDALEANGLQGVLEGVTTQTLRATDSELSESGTILGKSLFSLLPNLRDYVEGNPNEFATGIVAALSSVVRVGEERPAEEKMAEDTPKEANPKPSLMDRIRASKAEKPAEPAGQLFAKPDTVRDTERGQKSLIELLTAFQQTGIPMAQISLQPVLKEGGGLVLELAVNLGGRPIKFSDLATYSAIVRSLLNQETWIVAEGGSIRMLASLK